MPEQSEFRPVRRILSKKQAAAKLCISERTLSRLEPVLPPMQISPGRLGYFDDQVDAYALARTRAKVGAGHGF